MPCTVGLATVLQEVNTGRVGAICFITCLASAVEFKIIMTAATTSSRAPKVKAAVERWTRQSVSQRHASPLWGHSPPSLLRPCRLAHSRADVSFGRHNKSWPGERLGTRPPDNSRRLNRRRSPRRQRIFTGTLPVPTACGTLARGRRLGTGGGGYALLFSKSFSHRCNLHDDHLLLI